MPAASLLLLRDMPRFQVLLGTRSLSAKAFPGALVSPGGKLEPQDGDPRWADCLCSDGPEPRAAAVAAVRETFEETGVLMAHRADGSPDCSDLVASRAALERGELGFADLLDRHGFRLDGIGLVPFSRWITPPAQPYRFDTWFFLAEMRAPQTPLVRTGEFDTLRWWDVATAIPQAERDQVPLLPPTRANLSRLARSQTVAGALSEARKAIVTEPFSPDAP